MATVQDVKQYWDRRPCNIRHSRKPLGTREYFEEVERRKYSVEPHIPRFANFADWRGKEVLEIGCGIGTDSVNFVRNGANLTIVELSSESLAITKRRLELEGLNANFINGNAEELDELLPSNKKFDLIYSFGVIHHTPHPERVASAIAGLLKPGGELRLMVYARHSWKVLWIYARYGWREPWNWRGLVAKYSEAEIGSPVSFVYSRREARALLRGFQIVSMAKDHIFPYRILDYVQYRYVKNWYFRWMPDSWFHLLERQLGWHLLIVARLPDAATGPSISTAVVKKFRPWSGTVPPGFFAYFLGNLTRARYWAFPEEIQRIYDVERFETFSGPSIDDNIFDWLILLEAVVDARGEFVMIALGAGWGRWLVSAALAVKQFSGLPCRLVGVEAEPTHFQWMVEHFIDNRLDPSQHQLIEAAASGKSGQGWFYTGKADAWYGQSLIHDQALTQITGAKEAEHNGERARLVRTVDILEITRHYATIDYLHMDIQGAELDFLSKDPKILTQKVKRVLVGTHSREIENGLRELFGTLKWRCQYDIPLNGQIQVGDVIMKVGDGVQVWINPRFENPES